MASQNPVLSDYLFLKLCSKLLAVLSYLDNDIVLGLVVAVSLLEEFVFTLTKSHNYKSADKGTDKDNKRKRQTAGKEIT